MPAEWEPHEAVWLAWPHNSRDWPGKMAAVHWVYVEIVRLLAPGERVRILVNSAKAEMRVRRMLADVGVDFERVEFFRFPTDRSWLRDSGPTFVAREGGVEAVCWRFNAWAKYSNWRRDALIPAKIARAAGFPARKATLRGRPIVLEGGAFEVNGRGSVLATEECLLSDVQQRNPGMSRRDYETVFEQYLGASHTIWLGEGIAGDDTHGHVDDLARFLGPRTVAAVIETDRRDENYGKLRANRKRLARARDQDGRPLEIVELPMPRPIRFRGERLPASYANFYIGNRRVLAPAFNDPNDRVALRALESAFPEREVIGVHALDLVWGFGTLHCSVQQQPCAGL